MRCSDYLHQLHCGSLVFALSLWVVLPIKWNAFSVAQTLPKAATSADDPRACLLTYFLSTDQTENPLPAFYLAKWQSI